MTKMRREAESILSHTIYNKLIVRADSRLLSAFAGRKGAYVKSLEDGFEAVVQLEEKELPFGQYEMEKEKQK